jgi:hypothetical protein
VRFHGYGVPKPTIFSELSHIISVFCRINPNFWVLGGSIHTFGKIMVFNLSRFQNPVGFDRLLQFLRLLAFG